MAEERAIARLSSERPGVTADDGSLESPGIVYDAATVADINGMRIDDCTRPLSRRVLVLARADRPRAETLYDRDLAQETLAQAEAFGQRELMDLTPPYQELPLESVRHIVGWLAEGAGTSLRTISVPEAGGHTVVDSDTLGRQVIETPVTVPPAGLSGVLTEPSDGRTPQGTPLALMFNAGNHHHVGPARSWVDLSRRWAAAGIRSLRLDLSGLGDSPFRRPGERWVCNNADGFDDILDAARWASPDDPSNVVLVGLCSSAYLALEVGLLLRARGVVAVNPLISFVPVGREEGAPLDPRRRILLPQDAVTPVFRQGGRFGRLRERCPDLAWRTRILLSPSHRSGRWLTELVRQGTDTLIICGDDEIRPIRQGLSAAGLWHLRRSGLLRLEHVAGLDHALQIADQRHLVHDMTTDHVLSRFHPAPEGPRPATIGRPPSLSGLSA